MGLHVTPDHFRPTVPAGFLPSARERSDDPTALKAVGTIAHYARNQTIFSEGDPVAYTFKVVSGAVRLCKLLPDGRRQIAGFRFAGDYFGHDSDEGYTLTAESLSETMVVRYVRSQLARLEEERGDVRQRVMDMLRRDLWAAQNHLIMLGRQTAKERVASFLVQLAGRTGLGDGDQIGIPMSRQDMADYLGLTIETVCRAISDLKRRNIIGVPDRHHIHLHSMDALQAHADGDL